MKRVYKGQSLLELPNNYVVVDLETTGLNPKSDAIIEIGAIKVVDNVVVEEFQALINPQAQVSKFITDLTGISNEMLASQPPIEVVLPQFQEFLGTEIIVAHNANFDVNFLYDKYQEVLGVYLDNDFVDTLRISRRVFKDFDNHKLKTLIVNLNIAEETYHRALSDAVMTNKCYQKIKETVNDQNLWH